MEYLPKDKKNVETTLNLTKVFSDGNNTPKNFIYGPDGSRIYFDEIKEKRIGFYKEDNTNSSKN